MSERVLAGSLLDRQIRSELEAVQEGVKRYRDLVRDAEKRGVGSELKPAERLIAFWFKAVRQDIRREQRRLRRQHPAGARNTPHREAYLVLSADVLTSIVLHDLMSALMKHGGGMSFTAAAYGVGRAVIAECNIKTMRKEQPKLANRLRGAEHVSTTLVNRLAIEHLDHAIAYGRVCTHIGTRLLWSAIQFCSAGTYEEGGFRLAFKMVRKRKGKHTRRWIQLSPETAKLLEDAHKRRQFMRPRYRPMLAKPMPWSATHEGGYIRIRTPLFSKPTKFQKSRLAEAKMPEVYEGVNVLSQTGWTVNTRIAELVGELFDKGGGSLSLPPADDKPMPPKPPDIDTNKDALKAWKQKASETYSHNIGLRGQRCDMIESLRTAREYAGETFYLPHQLDFRGRAYPVPQFLNHHSDDPRRAMMLFAEPRDPGPEGERWLKIHAANCYGLDGAPFESRVQWTEQNMEQIERAAARGLDDEWWQQADEPWQFLAACHAMTDPEIGARMPVQIDGTCNGLQHYAAMSRDAEAAAAVNLVPAPAPVSPYVSVAKALAGIIGADEESDIAPTLEGQLDKPLVKQTVMTRVYGVTAFGAGIQLRNRLKERGWEDEPLHRASQYLRTKTLDAIGETLRGSEEIMAWLRACAVAISSAGHLVEWETTMGYPVVQSSLKYRRYRSKVVRTIVGTIMLADVEGTPPKVKSQANGCAPNFVHSLDATHMLMTAIRSSRADIAYAEVHDSYWSHAATMDTLARITREEFVALHEIALLDDLAAQWRARFALDLPDPPGRGSFDLTNVLRSPYFFS